MDCNTTMRDNKGKEAMGSEDGCELPGPDLKRTKMMSSSGGSVAGWWAKLGKQMRLMRSALKASLPGAQLDLELHKLVSDCLALYRSSTSSEISTDDDLPHVISVKHSVYIVCQASLAIKHPIIIQGVQHSSPLEAALMWLGGWRPMSALVLVFSVLGGESQGRPLSPAALQTLTSELSEEQLSNMINLQKHTQKAEHELSSKFAIFQSLVEDVKLFSSWADVAGLSKIFSYDRRYLLRQDCSCACGSYMVAS